ncbi:bifunctional diguanylate cyclase/phosphodiesterase [Kibdelosporangium aridum]|nr:GGDEF domain-containing phosphodiesterase [Kibdelosporangium aridum]
MATRKSRIRGLSNELLRPLSFGGWMDYQQWADHGFMPCPSPPRTDRPAESADRPAEQHFTAVVAAIEEGVIVVGATGTVESANPAAERILGVQAHHFIGMPMTETELHDQDGARIAYENSPFARTSRTGHPCNGQIVSIRRPDGAETWLSVNCRALNGERPSAVVLSFTDITERRTLDERREHEATHDALTGLANRTMAIKQLSPAMRRHHAHATAVLFVDLDKFKVINDSLGHSVGDQVLRVIGDRLGRLVTGEDLVSRLGGDEFAVIVHGVAAPDQAAALAGQIHQTLGQPITISGRQLCVGASIGITIADPADPRAGEELLRDADLAMYHAKTRGNGPAFFDIELRERCLRRSRLEQDLKTAPRDGQFWLAYQPIFDLGGNRARAVEGLPRWAHPRFGAVAPTEFIPLAEESGLINFVGGHILRASAEQIVRLRATQHPDLHLAMDLSARQLEDPHLATQVGHTLAATWLPPAALCLEIPESAFARDPAVAARTVAELRDLGVRLAIDHFGTGYSSLSQLLRLPLDTLKIDRSVIAGLGQSELGQSPRAEAIITSIVAMAHTAGLTVVADGVETAAQLDILRQLHCDQAQGDHISPPAPIEHLSARGLV